MKKIIKRREQIGSTNFSAGLHPLLQRLFSQRGLSTDEELERSLSALLPYHTLAGVTQAADCLADAMLLNKKIMLVGDYDADGATSTALAISCLRQFGYQQVTMIVPNRFRFGYGLTSEIVDEAQKQAPDLLLTVDNGIASLAGVERANQLGLTVVITDHHLAGATLPAAAAIVNPNQPGDQFPSKAMAGVGVIFYVMLALRQTLADRGWFSQRGMTKPAMSGLLDLVALGTVADVVPLDKNNRIMVYQGLRRIRSGRCRPGILALIQVANRTCYNLVAGDLGFAVAPRLNAAGRIDDMTIGIECLLADDPVRAHQLAQQLDQLNRERRDIEADMKQQAFATLDQLLKWPEPDWPNGICLYDQSWHQGVIGIIASRVKDKFHRPVIAFAQSGNELKGSARSIAGVHIRDLLDVIATQNPGLILKFGGHAMAAGLTISADRYDEFTNCFQQAITDSIDASVLERVVYSDGELSPNQFLLSTAELLREAGPWGQAFPEPTFDGEFVIHEQRLVGDKHLKLTLSPHDNLDKILSAIAFNVDIDVWPNQRVASIKAAYKLDINYYQDQKRLQLLLDYLEPV